MKYVKAFFLKSFFKKLPNIKELKEDWNDTTSNQVQDNQYNFLFRFLD